MIKRLLAAAAALTLASAVQTAPGVLGAEHAMSPEAIKERIKPVGSVCVQGEACKPVGLEAVAVAGAGAAAARSGEQVVNTVCAACHATGAAGAPKTGDKAAWASRIAQGEKTLVSNALNGIRAMPPRGTCGNCTDEEIAGAVKYFIGKAK